jgi:hypothetical protein
MNRSRRPPPAATWQTPDALLARRDFLRACAALAATWAGCGALSANTRLAADLADEPHPDRLQPIMNGLLCALLPFEVTGFPLRPHAVSQRLLEMFALYDDADFAGLRRGLIVFDDAELFPERLALLVDTEQEQLADGERLAQPALDAAIEEAFARDARAFAGFRAQCKDERFTHMALADQRAFLLLWSRSAFSMRRRFYRSAKVLAMLAAYSLPAMWREIGYDGPLLGQGTPQP